jgi:hypothetical protein
MLEARITKEAYIALVKNAAAAGMTMLRVWGGGIFFDDAFYIACDEAGLMLYHDMMCVRIVRTSACEPKLSNFARRAAGTPDMIATTSRTITVALANPSRRRSCSSRSADWRSTLRSCSGVAVTNAVLSILARKPQSKTDHVSFACAQARACGVCVGILTSSCPLWPERIRRGRSGPEVRRVVGHQACTACLAGQMELNYV